MSIWVTVLAVALTAAEQPEAARPLTIAAPGLQSVDVPPGRAEFFNDFFADKLGEVGQKRFGIVTSADVAAVLGHERQRALLGCEDGSRECLTELGNALGVEALVVGSVARLAGNYAFSLRVVEVGTGQVLARTNAQGLAEVDVLRWLGEAALIIARQLDPSVPEPGQDVRIRNNQLRLSVVGLEYDRRVSERWFLGGKLAIPFGVRVRDGALALGVQFLASGRLELSPPTSPWQYGAYGQVGLGALGPWTTGGDTSQDSIGLVLAVGAEAGYLWLRAFIEAHLIAGENTTVFVIPGILLAIPF